MKEADGSSVACYCSSKLFSFKDEFKLPTSAGSEKGVTVTPSSLRSRSRSNSISRSTSTLKTKMKNSKSNKNNKNNSGRSPSSFLIKSGAGTDDGVVAGSGSGAGAGAGPGDDTFRNGFLSQDTSRYLNLSNVNKTPPATATTTTDMATTVRRGGQKKNSISNFSSSSRASPSKPAIAVENFEKISGIITRNSSPILRKKRMEDKENLIYDSNLSSNKKKKSFISFGFPRSGGKIKEKEDGMNFEIDLDNFYPYSYGRQEVQNLTLSEANPKMKLVSSPDDDDNADDEDESKREKKSKNMKTKALKSKKRQNLFSKSTGTPTSPPPESPLSGKLSDSNSNSHSHLNLRSPLRSPLRSSLRQSPLRSPLRSSPRSHSRSRSRSRLHNLSHSYTNLSASPSPSTSPSTSQSQSQSHLHSNFEGNYDFSLSPSNSEGKDSDQNEIELNNNFRKSNSRSRSDSESPKTPVDGIVVGSSSAFLPGSKTESAFSSTEIFYDTLDYHFDCKDDLWKNSDINVATSTKKNTRSGSGKSYKSITRPNSKKTVVFLDTKIKNHKSIAKNSSSSTADFETKFSRKSSPNSNRNYSSSSKKRVNSLGSLVSKFSDLNLNSRIYRNSKKNSEGLDVSDQSMERFIFMEREIDVIDKSTQTITPLDLKDARIDSDIFDITAISNDNVDFDDDNEEEDETQVTTKKFETRSALNLSLKKRKSSARSIKDMLFDNVEKTDNNNNNDLLKDESNTDDQLKAELFEPDHSPTVMDVPALNIGEHALVKSDIEDDNLSAHPHSKENLSEQISSVTSPKITNANFEDEEEEEEEEEKELETAKTVRTSYSIDGYNDISEFVEKHLLTESDTEDLSQIQKDESLALGNETSFNLNEAETMVDVETETQFHSPVTQDSGAEEKTEAERGGKAVTEIEAEAETANEIENLKGSSSVQKQNRRHFRIFRRRKNNENNYTIEESKDTSVVTMDTKQSIEEEKEEKEEEQEGEVKNEQEKEQDEDEHEKKDEKQKKLKKPKKEKRKKKHKNDKTMDLECENEELQPLPTAKSIKSIKSTTSLKTTKSFKERLSRRRIRAYQKVFHPRHGKIENYDMDPWKKDNHVCDTCEDCSYIIGSGKSPSVKSPVTSDKSPFLNSPVPPKKDSDSDLHNHSNSSVEKEEQKEDESEANATKVIIVDEDIILPVEEKQYE